MEGFKRVRHFFVSGVWLLFAIGCASSPRPGQILSRVSDTEVEVALGGKRVGLGDHVELLENQCRRGPVAGSDAIEETCEEVPIAHGEVIQILSDDYSRVRFPPGTPLNQANRVARHKH